MPTNKLLKSKYQNYKPIKISITISACLFIFFILLNNHMNSNLIYSESATTTNKENDLIMLKSANWVLSPFIIDDTGNGNYTWAEASLEEWCSGSGTWNNPYTIENISINGNNMKTCIEITDSSAHFTIKNSTFYNSGTLEPLIRLERTNNGIFYNNSLSNSQEAGIHLFNSNSTTIYNNTITNCLWGVYFGQSSNNTLSKNFFQNNDYGIKMGYSHNNDISYNFVESSSDSGILVQNFSENNTIHHNTIQGNGFSGITISYCDNNNNFSYNTIENSFYSGIAIFDCSYINIFNNNCSDNGIGIYLIRSNSNLIKENRLTHNSEYGIFLYDDTNSNLLFLNYFKGNLISQAVDYSTANNWDNGSIGNFWSDYEQNNPTAASSDGQIWDTPYSIYNLGSWDSSLDRYPLVIPRAPIINHPQDISITHENNNYTIRWIITDGTVLNTTYFIYKNGTSILNGTWQSGIYNIFTFSNLSVGIHNFTIFAHDGLQGQVEDQVLIEVLSPVIGLPIQDPLMWIVIIISVSSLAFIVSLILILSRRKKIRAKLREKEEVERLGPKVERMEILLNEESIIIKKLILELGTKYTVLKIAEICEKAENDNELLIIDIVKDMIYKKEIAAEYFSNSESVAFDQQLNIDLIDETIKKYEDQGSKDGKKI